MSETRSFADESDFGALSKNSRRCLRATRGGGSEYLIRKIGARADFNKILIFLQNTLENVTERYL